MILKNDKIMILNHARNDYIFVTPFRILCTLTEKQMLNTHIWDIWDISTILRTVA